jgi:hypothetical protein
MKKLILIISLIGFYSCNLETTPNNEPFLHNLELLGQSALVDDPSENTISSKLWEIIYEDKNHAILIDKITYTYNLNLDKYTKLALPKEIMDQFLLDLRSYHVTTWDVWKFTYSENIPTDTNSEFYIVYSIITDTRNNAGRYAAFKIVAKKN